MAFEENIHCLKLCGWPFKKRVYYLDDFYYQYLKVLFLIGL